jgi:DHA3 family macrolide efflux protein-like MFS transporter
MSGPTRLMNKDFLLLWQGQFVSRLGSQAFTIAMMFWLKHATGSATLMGTLMMLSMLPLVILSPLGGTFADLHSRRRIIIACDVIHGVSVVSLALLLFWRPEATAAIIAWLTAVAVVSGVVSAFFQPAVIAAIPSIVPPEKVAAANSLNEGSFQVSTLVGQGIGGVMFRVLGAPVLFLIDGLTFLYSAVSEFFITIPQTIPEKKPSWRVELERFGSETREGLRYLWRRTGMRNMFVASAFLNFFAMPFLVLLPFYVEDILGKTPDWYGFLMAGYGGGNLVGYVLYGSLRIPGRSRSRLLIVSVIVLSSCLVLFGLSRRPLASLALIFTSGVFGGIYNVAAMTLIQLNTVEEYRGRMFGLLHTVVMGLSPISMGLAGFVADLLDRNVSLMFVACGVVLVVISVVMAANRDYREFLSSEPPKESAASNAQSGPVADR